MKRTLAHLSDLHLGRSGADTIGLGRAVTALVKADVDHVVVTGDITDGGQFDQLATFRRLTAPIADRMTVVPGNHDRIGENAGRLLMRGRVATETHHGLFLVRVDSTAPHNRRPVDAHGLITADDLADIDAALDRPRPPCSWRCSSTITCIGCRGTTCGSAWRPWSACPGPSSSGAARRSSGGCAAAAIPCSTATATCRPSWCWGAARSGRCGS